jgi:hypothetical protein
MVEAKGTFQQGKREHEDNDGIPYAQKHFVKHQAIFPRRPGL